MEQNQTISDTYHTRPATLDDALSVCDLINAHSLKYIGTNEVTADRIYTDWTTPGFDILQHTLLVLDADNTVIGYQEVWFEQEIPVHPWIWGRTHPDYEGHGIGTYMLQWAIRKAQEALNRVPEDVRVSAYAGCFSRTETAKALLEAEGWQLIRHSFRMSIELDSPPPKPKFPKGIQLRPYNPEKDAQAVFEADQDAFRDHFGYVEEAFEVAFPKFIHHMTQTELYDPSLWFVAWDGDEIAGICLCKKHTLDDPEAGYISSLGVRRPWRKRGLATALLYHAFGEFYRRGKRMVKLGVDGQNLTGALRLYKKVGMHIERQFDLFEKELRPGREISVQNLESAV